MLDVARSFARQVEDNTRHFTAHYVGLSPPPLPVLLPPAIVRELRVGYLSHDFGDHPTGMFISMYIRVCVCVCVRARARVCI